MPNLPNLEDPKQASARAATEKLVQRHFPRARRYTNGWGGFCPAHENRRTRALSINVGATGRLLLYCFAGCSFGAIVRAAKLEGVDISNLAAPAEHSPVERIAAGRRIWEETKPLAGSPAQAYLRHRGITIGTPTLGCHRGLAPSEIPQLEFPAMAAEILTLDGTFRGVQVTYLANDGSGKVPAFLDVPPRKIFGHLAGGAVRLAPAAETLVLAEGIETGLSIMQAAGIPVWATLGAGAMKAVELPTIVKEVVIAADNDPAGIAAAECARQRFIREGRRVRVVLPPVGNDFNQMVL
jgi:DNA primase